METPFFFRNSNYNLFGVLHEPDIHASNLQPISSPFANLGLVFCHPFAEEKLIAHRVMVNLARKLTEEGIYCLRFDYMGHGDSEGNFEDSTIETRLSDIQCAIHYLRKRTIVERVGLLGVRFGAMLAALTCANIPVIDPLILISPIIEGKAYIDQCLRSNLTTQMATYKEIIKDRKELISDLMAGQRVNIDGYLLTKDLYKQATEINLLNTKIAPRLNVLLLQLSRKKDTQTEKGLTELCFRYKIQGNKVKLLVTNGDNFWRDTKIYNPCSMGLQSAVVNWLLKDYSL